MSTYNPHKIEAKWRSRWPLERESYKLKSSDEPYYCLDMISYPSSEGLHMGHWRPYTIADVWARYQSMRGKAVLHPVGFDAFGLPAENAAIKSGTPPAQYTQNSVTNFARQIKEMGKMYDWSTTINTSDPSYYRWTQWLFLQLYKHGLAYRKLSPVWWCPSCATVLANEQVISGLCERCDSLVVKKELNQWFFKITDFADELLNFDDLAWPERVKLSQKNWIGKSTGVRINFGLENSNENISVFTTRPDTLYGVTYLVLAPEHQLVDLIATPEYKSDVENYRNQSSTKTEIDRLSNDKNKTGVFTGAYAVHPLTNHKLPIWIADYVLVNYGTGAVMAVPAHDQRDFDFAKKYFSTEYIKNVIEPTVANSYNGLDDLDKTQGETIKDHSNFNKPYTGHGKIINSPEFNELNSSANFSEIAHILESKKIGSLETTYRLRDWLVSRQRYWGAPIPIVYCNTCGEQPVNEANLPVLLPENIQFKSQGGSLLESHSDFVVTPCPNCGEPARRETDTLDTFVDSSWYYLRFSDPKNDDMAFDFNQVKAWLPVDFYVGGVEHSILHLLYSRFIMKALYGMKLVPYNEPFQTFYGNGMVYLRGSKMSKSKGNVVNPDEMVKQFGSDVLRGYILFMGPADQDVEWQENGIVGVRRFLDKAWQVFNKPINANDHTIHPAIQEAVNSINELLVQYDFNRCISTLMIAINNVLKSGLNKNSAKLLCQLFAPFFPHFAEEIWEILGEHQSVFTSQWPESVTIIDQQVTYAIQINGKTKSTMTVSSDLVENSIIEQAKQLPAIVTALSGTTILKTIYVHGRIINFVIK